MARSPRTDPRRALEALEAEVVSCVRCPRLVAYRTEVARVRRKQFRDQVYWGRPVPGFGDPCARLLVVGLAPAAHGGNRTGRIFTGDRSGDWLFEALHRFGFANQPFSHHRDDGLELRGAYVTAAVRCAPPANKPTREELENCRPYLVRELELLRGVRIVVALGKIAWDAYFAARAAACRPVPKPRPKFAHGARVDLGDVLLLGSYHPSQQNTFTGKLTRRAFHAIFARVRRSLGERRLDRSRGLR
ncbi:MAG: uracil-DNA glycosylase [Candidatus Binatia bacterium]|nr:MAG: uracil-DNA glycosylase [Candidatus Binatia bacterium]